MSRRKKAQDRLAAIISRQEEILQAADAEARELTDDETKEFDDLDVDAKEQQRIIEMENRLDDKRRSLAAVVPDSAPLPSDDDSGGTDPRANENRFGSFGEQLQAIFEAGRPAGRIDPRLIPAAAASGGSSQVGTDGGFLIQTQFSQEIYKRVYELGILAGRCRRVPIGADADALEVPYIKESSRATGSRLGGVRVYRKADGDTVTASRPKIDKMRTELEDLMGIAYATNNLLRDAAAMDSVYRESFAQELSFTLDDEIFNGDGAGKCLGLLNAPALVTVAKETNQTAATIVPENVVKMWSRCWARSRGSAVWFINQDIEPQLYTMGLATGTAGQLVFMPAGGLSGAPYATLFGRPVLPIEQAATLGTVGDIVLADMSEYLLIDKDGVRSDVSMHVRFLYDEMTFRFIMRVNGQPIWQSALTPYKGSATKSPYVALATRA